MLDPLTRTAKVRCTLTTTPPACSKPEDVRDRADRRPATQHSGHPRAPRCCASANTERSSSSRARNRPDTSTSVLRMPVDVDEGEASPWLEVKEGLERGQLVVTSGAILLSQRL